ncbi:MAG TPA: DUF4142 domain-containing protein [Caulobacteraceae bacterium]|nr:DUF4142 domain-containing protein [Caulobacteraceae bacterium]
MKSTLVGGFALAALIAAGAHAQQATSRVSAGRVAGDAAAGPVGLTSASTIGSMNTHAFVENAARSDMYEIQASKMALARSHNPHVKAFAERMIRDHTHTTAELKSHLPPGVAPPSDLDARRSGMLDNLREGKEFDKRFVAQQVTAHEEALTLMRGFAKRGDNPRLKVLAGQTAPLIEHHLQMAKQLRSQVGG